MDRSKSYAGPGRMQIEPYYGSGGAGRMQIEPYNGGGGGARPDFRSYSYSGGGMSSSYSYQYEFGGGAAGSAGPGGLEEMNRSKSSKRRWLTTLGDPDLDRKRRVAAYKAYGVEGRVKGSFRKSFKWIKDRYLHLVYGWS